MTKQKLVTYKLKRTVSRHLRGELNSF